MFYFALIASFLIALVYIRFLRQMDVFEPEQWRYTWICFLLGVFSVAGIFSVYYFFPQIMARPQDGNFAIRFQFHFFSVASLEELAKISPFLLLLLSKRVINESFDYIKYASLGAMGFAALENVLYFSRNLHIIEGRAFYTAVMHMFTSSLIAYCMYAFKKRSNIPGFVVFCFAYPIAAGFHGLFNALISSGQTYLLGIGLVLCMLIAWGRMMNNTLNHSEFFHSEPVQNKITMAGIQLLIGWGLVFLFAAFAIGILEGWSQSFVFLREGFVFGFISGAGLYLALARPRIRQGKWFPLIGRLKKE
jgi:RsiW-degrading membrane proteinase PrsW (M82 family)